MRLGKPLINTENFKMKSYRHYTTFANHKTDDEYFEYYFDTNLRLWTVLFIVNDKIHSEEADYFNNKNELLDKHPYFKFKDINKDKINKWELI